MRQCVYKTFKIVVQTTETEIYLRLSHDKSVTW